MASVLPPDQAYALTKPFHRVWADAHHSTWAMWQDRLQNDPSWFKVFTAGDRYLMIHRHVCDLVASQLEGKVQHAPSLDFFAQIVGDRALVRFKHLDEDLRPRNYPTDQQQHLDRQEFTERMETQLALDGIAAPLTVLTVGYTLTTGEEAIGQIVVTCHVPELWYWFSIDAATGQGFGGSGGDGEAPRFPGIESPGPRIIPKRPRQKPEGEQGEPG